MPQKLFPSGPALSESLLEGQFFFITTVAKLQYCDVFLNEIFSSFYKGSCVIKNGKTTDQNKEPVNK